MTGNCKYYKLERYVSFDSGQTWSGTGEYSQGALIESASTDCGYVPPTPIYEWRDITPTSDPNTYICNNCPEYRTTSGTPYCSGASGYDKYVDVYSQVSYDSGQTWTTTATTPTLVEANSEDCGFVPPTPHFSLISYQRESHYNHGTFTGKITGTNGFSASFKHNSALATKTLVDNIEGTLRTYGYVMDSSYDTIEPYGAIVKDITITTIEGIIYSIRLYIGKGLKGELTTVKK